MPQVQFIDRPNIGGALGKFGSGILEGYTAGQEKHREEDALQSMLSEVQRVQQEGGSEEDVMSTIVGFKGLDLEKKKTVTDIFKDIGKRRADTEYKKNQAQRDEARLELSRDKQDLELEKLDQKERMAYKKDMRGLNSAINTLKEMKKTRDKGNLGKTAYLRPLGPDTQRDKGSYKADAKSLITKIMGPEMRIRNVHEFRVAADDLMDVYLWDAEADGMISSLERRFNEEIDFLNSAYKRQEGGDSTEPSGKKYTLEQIRAAKRRKGG